MNQHELKRLQTQLTKLNADLTEIKSRYRDVQEELDLKRQQILRLTESIEEQKKKDIAKGEISVTEHAILRYLERTRDIDIEGVKQEMLTDSLKKCVEKLGGSGVYPINGCRLKMKDFTVITVLN